MTGNGMVMAARCFLKKVEDYHHDRLRAAVGEGLAALQVTAALFRPGQRILLKPNFLSACHPERGVTTHPAVVAAVAECLADFGCELYLGDSPALDSLEKVIRKAGYQELIRRYGIRLAPLQREHLRPSRSRRWFPRLHLARELDSFDHVVNLPKLKTHSMMTLTLGVKNVFGCVPGKHKAAYHLSAGENRLYFARLLLEIWETVRPGLTILDGIVGMQGNGPGQGQLRSTGLLAMADDALALDAVIGHLLGVPADQHPVVAEAIRHDFASARWAETELSGDAVADCRVSGFQLPAVTDLRWRLPDFLARRIRNWFTTRPVIDPERCVHCGACAAICPTRAVRNRDGQEFEIVKELCIRCYCCHEVCPARAVDLRPGQGTRLLYHFSGSDSRE
ncbi:MAG: DUF362 domain-containing protein [Acidobacteria bacterium]|nr:DUF362 domain-containing protein [Acidobacteriota bacterium]